MSTLLYAGNMDQPENGPKDYCGPADGLDDEGIMNVVADLVLAGTLERADRVRISTLSLAEPGNTPTNRYELRFGVTFQDPALKFSTARAMDLELGAMALVPITRVTETPAGELPYTWDHATNDPEKVRIA